MDYGDAAKRRTGRSRTKFPSEVPRSCPRPPDNYATDPLRDVLPRDGEDVAEEGARSFGGVVDRHGLVHDLRAQAAH